MKILVEMSPEHYDRLLDKLSEVSAAYAILKNGVVVHPSGASSDRIIHIACEMAQAETMLHAARQLFPAAAPELQESIGLARAFRK